SRRGLPPVLARAYHFNVSATAMARFAGDRTDSIDSGLPGWLRSAAAVAAPGPVRRGAPSRHSLHACGARTDESRIQAMAHGCRRDGAAGTGLGAAGAR